MPGMAWPGLSWPLDVLVLSDSEIPSGMHGLFKHICSFNTEWRIIICHIGEQPGPTVVTVHKNTHFRTAWNAWPGLATQGMLSLATQGYMLILATQGYSFLNIHSGLHRMSFHTWVSRISSTYKKLYLQNMVSALPK